jgi:hypothetical protein
MCFMVNTTTYLVKRVKCVFSGYGFRALGFSRSIPGDATAVAR